MNIRDLTSSSHSSALSSETSAATGASQVLKPEGRTVRPAADSDQPSQTSQLAELHNRLAESPQVREEAVAAARIALRSGELLSRAAAEESARAFLNGQ